MVKKHPYYDVQRILTFNAILNFLIGSRGLGKTFGFKVWAIKRNIKYGKQFIYLRRFQPEIKTSKTEFYSDIISMFPEWEFRTHGNWAQRAIALDPKEYDTEAAYNKALKQRTWVTMGYFVTLSVAQSLKGVSYHNVETIIFDEFIIEDERHHQYLSNEANVFLNFYVTVDRFQDRCRVFFLANSVTISNPYFIKWKIRPDQLPELSTRDDGYMLIHLPDADDYKSSVRSTRLGQFIAGTDYESFAIGNEFKDAHHGLVKKRPSTATHQFNLELTDGKVSVWYDSPSSDYFVEEKLVQTYAPMYTILPHMMGSDKVLVTFQDKVLAYLRTAFRGARVYFDGPESRNSFVEIFKR